MEPVVTAAHSLSPGLTRLWSERKDEKIKGQVVRFLTVDESQRPLIEVRPCELTPKSMTWGGKKINTLQTFFKRNIILNLYIK